MVLELLTSDEASVLHGKSARVEFAHAGHLVADDGWLTGLGSYIAAKLKLGGMAQLRLFTPFVS